MTRAAILLSVSGYSWYLVFAYNQANNRPDLGGGMAGLFFLSIIPTILGITTTRKMLASSPTVLKLILCSTLQYLLYTCLVALGSYLTASPLSSLETYHWKACIFPAFWQLLSWVGGVYYAFHSGEPTAGDRPAHLHAVEISLIIIPAVFLLTFMGFPSPVLVMLVFSWFMALALTLALEGSSSAGASNPRHEIIFFHALVPVFAAIILFFAAFSREAHFIMQGALQAFSSLLGFLAKLLDMFFSRVPQSTYEPPKFPFLNIRPEAEEKIREMPSWFLIPFFILGIYLLYLLLQALIRLLKTRLEPAPALPVNSFSLAETLRQLGRWLFVLVNSLLRGIVSLLAWSSSHIRRLWKKIRGLIRSWLPARSPEEKIFRVYHVFLRLAGQSINPRQMWETPLEFAHRLEKQPTTKKPFPNQEIRQLTCLFLEARYSLKPISWQKAAESEKLLRMIKERL